MRHFAPLPATYFGFLALLMTVSAAIANPPATRPSTRPATRALQLSDCPKPVQRTMRAEAKSARIDSVEIDPGAEGEEDYFVASAEMHGHTYDITVAADGQLIEKRLANDSERTVTLDECPKAVRETLAAETNGAKIDEIDREARHGAVTFTAGVDTDDGYYWIVVARDGTLLDKYLDDSDEQDPGPQPRDPRHPQQA